MWSENEKEIINAKSQSAILGSITNTDFIRKKYNQPFIEFTGGEEIEPANRKAFYSGRERDRVPSLGWAHKSGNRVYQSLHKPYGDSFVWICKRDNGHSVVAGKDKL